MIRSMDGEFPAPGGRLSHVFDLLSRRMAWTVLLSMAMGVNASGRELKAAYFVTDEEKRGGYLVELTTEALKRQGYEVHIDYMPWARALNLVLEGSSNGLLGAYYNEERAKALLFSEPLAESELALFALKGSGIVCARLEDLTPYSVGTIRGAKYPPAFEHASNLKKIESSSFEVNLKNLLARRLSLFVEKKLVVLNYLKTVMPENADRIVVLKPPLATEKSYVCFSRQASDGQEKITDLNRGLALLRTDGTYRKILKIRLHE